MGSKKNFKPTNNSYDTYYKPSIIGKIAIAVALPATLVGFVAIIIGMFAKSIMWNCLTVGIVAEIIAVAAAVFIVVDIIAFNRKAKKDTEKFAKSSSINSKDGKNTKKEKDIRDLLRFLIGFGLGLLLGYLMWGIK